MDQSIGNGVVVHHDARAGGETANAAFTRSFLPVTKVVPSLLYFMRWKDMASQSCLSETSLPESVLTNVPAFCARNGPLTPLPAEQNAPSGDTGSGKI